MPRRAELAHRAEVERISEFVELEAARYVHAGALPFGTQKIVGLPALWRSSRPCCCWRNRRPASRDERDDLARFNLRISHALKLAMIWIEHDMQMVVDLADRLHVLNYGRTLVSGAPNAVLSDPAVIAAYLGVGRSH